MSECLCPLDGFCTVRQVSLRVTLQMLCKTDSQRVDRFLACQLKATTLNDYAAPGAGTAILKALEEALGCRVPCSPCLQYLLTLNHTDLLDCDEIVAKLSITMALPPQFSAADNTPQNRQEWLRPIITEALLAWSDSP